MASPVVSPGMRQGGEGSLPLLHTLLATRDREERPPALLSLLEHDQAQCRALKRSRQERTSLVAQLRTLQEEHAQTMQQLETVTRLGSPAMQARVQELEQALADLQREQADLYKKQAVNTQRVLELLDTTTAQRQEGERLTTENAGLRERVAVQEVRQRDAAALVGEKEGVITILKDELHLHQLELQQREGELSAQRRRVEELEEENRVLVERWVARKQLEALHINEENEAATKRAAAGGGAGKTVALLPAVMASGTPSFRASLLDFFGGLPRRQVTSTAPPEDAPLPLPERPVLAILPRRVERRILTPHSLEVNGLAVSRDGQMLATASSDKTVVLYDTAVGGVRRSLSGLTQSALCTAFNEPGDLVLGTCSDGSIHVWSTETSRTQHTLTGHIGKVMTAIFTPQSRVISGSHDRTIKVFDLAKGYCIRNLFTVSSCNDLCAMDADGNVIVSGHMDGRLRIWDTRTGNLIHELADLHTAQVTSVCMAGGGFGPGASARAAPSAAHLLTASRDDTLCVVDARMYTILHRLHDPECKLPLNWSRATLSPDARYVGVGGVEGSLFLWDVGGGGEVVPGVTRLKEHGAPVCAVAWNPRGAGVYSVDRERNLLFWE